MAGMRPSLRAWRPESWSMIAWAADLRRLDMDFIGL